VAPSTWSRTLSEPVKVIGRKAPIATLAEARAFILKLPAARQARNEWQYAARDLFKSKLLGNGLNALLYQNFDDFNRGKVAA
jgi:hypothetical protein